MCKNAQTQLPKMVGIKLASCAKERNGLVPDRSHECDTLM